MKNKDDAAILKMSTSLTYMIYMSAHDVLGFGQKRLIRLWENMCEIKDRWAVEEITTAEMLGYCEKKGINPYPKMKQVSQQQKLKLVGNNITVLALKFIESAMLMNMMIATIVLKETFHKSNADIEKAMDKVVYYVDSYTRRQPKIKECYLNDRMIIEILKDECKLDVEKGIRL